MEARPDGIFDEASRRPTNKFWLIPFAVAVIAFVVLGIIASQTAGIGGLANYSNTGKTCGFDSNVLDKPLRIFVDERDCSKNRNATGSLKFCHAPFICVKECPTGDFDELSCNSVLNFEALKQKLVCEHKKIYDKINNCGQLRNAVQNKDCVGWYENTYELFGACYSRAKSRKSSDGVDVMEMNVTFGEAVLALIPSFLYAIIIAAVVSFFFILTLKWSAAYVFWGFVGVIIVGLTGLLIGVVITVLNGDALKQENGYLALVVPVVIIGVVLLILILLLYFFRKKIRCGIEIVKESSRAVCASIGAILFPLLPFLFRAVVLLAALYILVQAMTLRNNTYNVIGLGESRSDCSCKSTFYGNGTVCNPKDFNADCVASDGGICIDAACKLTDQVESELMYPFYIVTLILTTWIIAFIQANSKMILAHVYGNWYWNYNRDFIPTGAVLTAMGKILSNHSGTAAFGAFIIMICRMLKSLLSNRDNSGNNGIGAIIGRVIVEIFRACAQVLLDLVEFVSDKAFVIVAIMGTGFWDSVKTVSTIMVKDIPLVVATEYVGDIILFVCKFVAAVLSAALFYFTSPFKGDDMYITIILTFIIFAFAYDLAGVLLSAYDVAIDTLLICTLQDYMHNKTEKAYFQSETLNELLLKKKEEA